jgi:FkbM family methyltransferase
MLIPFEKVVELCQQHGKYIRGVLHVGAHDCEEREPYNKAGISDRNIYWVEALQGKVDTAKEKGIPNIYKAAIYDVEKEVEFNVSNDSLSAGSVQSSSILPFGVHAQWYPHITMSRTEKMKTTRLDKWIQEHAIPIERLNFWNLDIQGVELQALKSAGDALQHADILYIEVNVQELYVGCALLPELDYFLQSHGFQRIGLQMAVQGWGDAIYVRQP